MGLNRKTRADRIVTALLDWYVREHRKLPWRAEPGELSDPYRTLVSEAMLQQTQVATVIDYFNRFIARFPSVESLAAAHEDDVLAQWQGLGYYRRARHLHKAAKVIVEQHGGRLPSTAAELIKLPGVGAYTAGAVASMAFGEASPVVDGNVMRVLARVDGYGEPVDSTGGKKWMWERARELVADAVAVGGGARGQAPPLNGKHPGAGDWNQAVMELGARVCLPRGAKCEGCPIGQWCEARATGRVDELPVTGKRTKQVAVTHRVIAIERRGKWLIERRGDNGLWAGMWQMPTEEGGVGDSGDPDLRPRKGLGAGLGGGARSKGGGKPSAAGLTGWVRERLGLEVGRPRWVGGFEHVTSHRLVRFEVWRTEATGGRLRRGGGQWRGLGDVSDVAMSRAQRRVAAMLGEAGGD